MALSGCTDYLFPPQPLENIESKQLNGSGYQNDLSEIARDPGNNFSLEAGTAEVEDPDETYRQRQLEREALMKRLEAKQMEMADKDVSSKNVLSGALLNPDGGYATPGQNTALITSMSDKERQRLLNAIHTQLAEYQNLGIPPIRDERADLLMPRIYFDFDKSAVQNDFKDRLLQISRNLLRELEQRGDMILQVEGHADERGNEEYNLVLGHQRANSVKNLLKSYVADPASLQTVSFGEEFPAVPQSDEKAWSQNRRVQFTFLLRP
jgi:outer membrane protein OmpA-like peptidoglycan-associated protein